MIKPSTLQFLNDLKQNNERPWFQDHKESYLDAKKDFEQFIQRLLLELTVLDSDYGKLSVKDCVFRIYRDIRFSKNKTPYKVHLAAGINKGGKKVHFPGFHVHIEPENFYLGGGIWRPDKEALYKIRQEIDYNTEEFRAIIEKNTFKKMFGALDTNDKLKRPPRGYEKTNPAIDYLKLKSIIAHCTLEEKDVVNKGLVNKVVGIFKELNPLLKFLETALD